jgi:hypothetical protein
MAKEVHMNSNIFDSLQHTKSLEKVGFSRSQAEKQVEIMGNIINSHLLTKAEYATFHAQIQTEFAKVRGEMAVEFATVRGEMKDLENRLLIKLGGLMIGLFTISTAILGYLIQARG